MAIDTTGLTPSQEFWLQTVIDRFKMPSQFWANPESDIVTPAVLEAIGDLLRIHHAFSRQALSKDRFEFALEGALQRSQIPAELTQSRTNPGHDITIRGVPCSLKTEAAKNIRASHIHISKFMELGKGEWHLPDLRDRFLNHMRSYERIFTFRHIVQGPERHAYELMEIPKSLFLRAANARLEMQEGSKQNPKPGYGYVEEDGNLLFSLYFDGGTERKLQIKHLDRRLCHLHANWAF